MIERVARAILKRRFYDCEPDMYVDLDWFFWVMENESGEIWPDALNEARAAIEAMREPDNAMLNAASKAMSPDRRPTPKRVSVKMKHRIRYRAMIDAALKDEA